MTVIYHSPMVRRVTGEMLIMQLENIGEEAFELEELLASNTATLVVEKGSMN